MPLLARRKGGLLGVAESLIGLVERSVAGMGYELVDLERAGGGLLRVTVDVADGSRAVRIEDCERVTRQLAQVLTVENVDYGRLEVGSPGVDRRLRRGRDFARFAGAQVDVRLRALKDGRRRLRGRLLEIAGAEGAERIRIEIAPPDDGASQGKGAEKKRKGHGKGGAGAQVGKKAGSRAAEEVAAATVELDLADIDTARLVPDLNFKGVGRGVAK